MTLLKIIWESILQAFEQLVANKLRSFLTLVGISIGIFCIIGVFSAVDSLEDNVRGSLQKLGSDVIYVKKWPWEDVSGNWWDYIKRPNPDHNDYEVLTKKVKSAQLTSFHVVIGFKTVKYKASSVEQAVLIGSSLNFPKMFEVEFDRGRYFSPSEYHFGSNKIILGAKVADELFGTIEPIGKTIKLSGRKFEIIGTIAKAGNDLLNPMDFDDCIIVSYNAARALANLKARRIFDTTVNLKAAKGVKLEDLKDEVTGVLRSHRRLKPKEMDDFSLNELSMISKLFDSFFVILSMIGLFIGGFAILVGGFSVANIMFVSVKERTNIIGVKKALGAKNYMILMEFLIESVILCILGGLIGLGLIYIIMEMLSNAIEFDLHLSLDNMILGVGVAVGIGIVSGIIPAIQAAKMDPVEAMRQ